MGKDSDHVKRGERVGGTDCLRPKKSGGGGLGIKDLEKFGRALRLRWLWHK
jgi:hypothetical protein